MKYCEEIIKDIEEGLKAGLTKKSVCESVGITEDTFYAWVKTKPEFSERIKASVSKGKLETLALIRAHGEKQWQALAWILERCYPDEFGLKTKQELIHDFKTMTQEQRDKEIERLAKLRDEQNGG